jgi:amidase
VDVVLTPTLADLPPLVGELRDDDDPAGDFAAQTRFTPWTSVWNLTGRPAVSLPLGWHAAGEATLPVGVMLGAGFGDEETLIAVAAQLERVQPWRNRYRSLDRLLDRR